MTVMTMRIPVAACSLLVLACGALCGDEESRLGLDTVILRDVQGLWGGVDVYLNKDGKACVRIVRPPVKGQAGLQEKRYQVSLTQEHLKALDRLLGGEWDRDVQDRPGKPDEGRPEIFVRMYYGTERTVAKWANDKRPGFDDVYDWLRKVVVEQAVKQAPSIEGAYDPTWHPKEFVTQEDRLEAIAKEYDTIVIGKIVSVSIRPQEQPFQILDWSLIVGVDEQLQGKPLPNREIAIYVHSPTEEGLSPDEKSTGHPCVWALKCDGEVFTDVLAPFFLQEFHASDLQALRRAVQSLKQKRMKEPVSEKQP